MKVGVLGSGEVAKSLAKGFVKYGHDVLVGSRTPAKVEAWAADLPGARFGTFADAAAHGEAVALAVRGAAASEALALAGSENLAGKIVIDATNPIAGPPGKGGILPWFTTLDSSLMERLQAEFPRAKFVKAFNSVGHFLFVDPQLEGGRPSMFICGDDDGAKRVVSGVIDQFGWEVEDMGGVEAARAIEPLCILWCIPGLRSNDWMWAFKMIRPRRA
jgi:predicted dinucleotide-binding enzyme